MRLLRTIALDAAFRCRRRRRPHAAMSMDKPIREARPECAIGKQKKPSIQRVACVDKYRIDG